MGYYTDYILSIYEASENFDIKKIETFICNKQEENDDFMYAIDLVDIFNLFSGKWYEHDKDMKILSKNFSSLVFKLHGEGEETPDIWDAYYKNGKKCMCKATIHIPSFNENELEEIGD